MARIRVGSVQTDLPGQPQVQAPAAAFGPGGQGLAQAGEMLTGIGDRIERAEQASRTRRETVETLRLGRQFDISGSEAWRNFRTENDISDANSLRRFSEEMRGAVDATITGFQGSAEGRMRLAEDLEKRMARIFTEAAKEHAKEQDAIIENAASEVIGEISFQAAANPEAIGQAFLDLDANLDALSPAMTESQRADLRNRGRSQIIRGVVQSYIDRNDLQTADIILEDTPGIGRFLDPDTARQLRREIVQRRRAMMDQPLERIADPTSPTGIRLVPRPQAAGQPGVEMRPVLSPGEQAQAFATQQLLKADSERITDIEAQADAAASTRAQIQSFREIQAQGGFTPGVFSEARTFLARVADFVGASDNVRNAIGSARDADALQAISRNMATEMAERMSRVTNMSLIFIEQALPGLYRTPEGNEIILELMERTAEREIARANLTEEYLARHNGITRPVGERSLWQMLRDYEEANPFITPDFRARIEETSRRAPSAREVFDAAERAVRGDATETRQEVARPTTQEEYEALPSGTQYIHPSTGDVRVKQ